MKTLTIIAIVAVIAIAGYFKVSYRMRRDMELQRVEMERMVIF